jgi:hypothetical protein
MSKPKSGSTSSRKWIWIILSLFVLALAGGYTYYTYAYLPSQVTTDEPALQTATVRRGNIVLYASGTGTLIPAAEASFGFETSGQVIEVLVAEAVPEDSEAREAS